MACNYCNSTKSPNPDGTCPDCGRVVSQSQTNQQTDQQTNQQTTAHSGVNEKQNYPIQNWRCTWMLLFFKAINALLIGGVLAGGVWALFHYVDNENLNKWQNVFWIVAVALPSVYFVYGFFCFLYSLFIKRYELRPKEIRLIYGIFNMSTNSTLLEALWGMRLRQRFLQRFFRIGRITLFSDDNSSSVLHINDIGNIRNRFNKLVSYQEYALDCSNVKVERDANIDTSVQHWRHSWRDFFDETFWGILITVLSVLLLFIPWDNNTYRLYFTLGVPVVYWLCGLIWTLFRGTFFTSFTRFFGLAITGVYAALAFFPCESALRIGLVMSIPVIYWCWLFWTFIDKIFFTLYTLNNATLIKESGIFSRKIDVYVLCHITDCDMSQNLWQKMVGDVGNIIFSVKWDNSEESEQPNQKKGKKKTEVVLHGLKNHQALFETFRERWLRERHRRQA